VSATIRTYGHADAPDWLDEAAAVMCEPRAEQEARASVLRDPEIKRIPLAELLTMTHPAMAMLAQMLGADSGMLNDGKTHTVRVESSQSIGADNRMAVFYSESGSFARFLVTTRGAAGFRAVADAVIHGKSVTSALASAGAGESALPVLEAEWIAWEKKP
jgi:hypothetical protein